MQRVKSLKTGILCAFVTSLEVDYFSVVLFFLRVSYLHLFSSSFRILSGVVTYLKHLTFSLLENEHVGSNGNDSFIREMSGLDFGWDTD